jgi:hypothetical protein
MPWASSATVSEQITIVTSPAASRTFRMLSGVVGFPRTDQDARIEH